MPMGVGGPGLFSPPVQPQDGSAWCFRDGRWQAAPITTGLTMNTARLLGRSTAAAGAIEEITVGSGLTLAGGSLSASSTLSGSGAANQMTFWSSATGLTGSTGFILTDGGADPSASTFTIGGKLYVNVGTAALPSVGPSSDTDTGLWFAPNEVSASTSGTTRMTVANSSVTTTVPLLTSNGSAGAPGHAFAGDPDNGLYYISSDRVGMACGGVLQLDISTTVSTLTNSVAVTPAARTGTPARDLSITPGAHTALTASTEFNSIGVIGATQTFATGNLGQNNLINIGAPAYAFAGASIITDAATLSVSGAPTAGTNATITNPWALWLRNTGHLRMDGNFSQTGSSTFSTGTGAHTLNGNVTVTSGKTITAVSGIIFSNETMDQYDEGTWTPTIFGSGTAGTPTYSTQNGSYTRIGRKVFCEAYVVTTAKTGIAGNVSIGGLPFTIKSTVFAGASLIFYGGFTLPAGCTQLGALNGGGVTSLAIYASGSAVASAAIPDANIAAATSFIISFCYEI